MTGPASAPTVISVGEVLWDLFPDGERLGGAPANLAVHAASLGGNVSLVSAVGDDERGRSALQELAERGVNVDLVRTVDAPTGTVVVSLRDGQPTYTIVENVAWDRIASDEAVRERLSRADVFCWGTLAQRTEEVRSALVQMVGVLRENCLKVLDINFRQHFHSARVVRESLLFADVVKINEDEALVLRDYLGATEDPVALAAALRDWFEIDCVVVTRGDQGCIVVDHRGHTSHEVVPVKVCNTVGSGDAFTAAFALHRYAGASPDACAAAANEVGAFAASQDSGTPRLPDSMRVFS